MQTVLRESEKLDRRRQTPSEESQPEPRSAIVILRTTIGIRSIPSWKLCTSKYS